MELAKQPSFAGSCFRVKRNVLLLGAPVFSSGSARQTRELTLRNNAAGSRLGKSETESGSSGLSLPSTKSLFPGMSTLAQTNTRLSANVEVCFEPNCRGAGKWLAALQD